MSSLRFSMRLGWGTLRARPALTVLAILLLTLGVSVLVVMISARYLLYTARAELLSGPSLELELASDRPSTYAEVMSRVEQWPDVIATSYVSPDELLREIETEAGDSLKAMLGSNPFPPLVRVRFAEQDANLLDSLTAQAKTWPQVTAVAYPKQVWRDLNELAERLNHWLWIMALPLLVVVLALTALCLRAQVRNRGATWEFLSLLGMSRSSLRLAMLTQQVVIGLISGLFSYVLLMLALRVLQWLLLMTLDLPSAYILCALAVPIPLCVVAGLFSRPTGL